jgi:hypothetical protein
LVPYAGCKLGPQEEPDTGSFTAIPSLDATCAPESFAINDLVAGAPGRDHCVGRYGYLVVGMAERLCGHFTEAGNALVAPEIAGRMNSMGLPRSLAGKPQPPRGGGKAAD